MQSIVRVLKAARFIASGFFVGLVCVVLSGCASLQSEAVLAGKQALPRQIELADVPFIPQAQFQCGPAALATLLQYNARPVTAEELARQVYLPGREGSVQIEMLAAVRRYQLVPYVLPPSLAALLAEVSAGHPVLVLQNLGLAWMPTWHYAVVAGFDLDKGEIVLRSGLEQRHVVALKVFERTWARSDYWAMVAMQPDRLPATVTEPAWIETLIALEQSRHYRAAIRACTTALQHWPDNLAAYMGLANSHYALQDFVSAVEVLQQAIQRHPDAADAFNNLADSLSQLQRYDEARQAIQRALELGGPHHDVYLQTQRDIEQRANRMLSPVRPN